MLKINVTIKITLLLINNIRIIYNLNFIYPDYLVDNVVDNCPGNNSIHASKIHDQFQQVNHSIHKQLFPFFFFVNPVYAFFSIYDR